MSEVIKKSVSILIALKPSEEKSEWTTTELSKDLNMPIQTVHRLLTSLSDHGFVYKDTEKKHLS